MSPYTPARTGGGKPIAFLGLAGVIYLDEPPATPVTLRRVSAWGKWARTVAIPESAPGQIAALAHTFDIVWICEWGHNAHTAFREALGLPAEPWPSLPVQFGKLAAIRRYARDLPWAWIDDTLVIEQAADGVVVPVDPRLGIAAVDIAAVEAAVVRRSAGTVP